jgi:iron-sulfur cluster assembly protein
LRCVACERSGHDRDRTRPFATRTTLDDRPAATVVSLTDAAVGKLLELTKDEPNPAIGLRVYVYSGGCSGFRYRIDARGRPRPPRIGCSTRAGSRSTSTAQSVSLLQGSEIDYVDTLKGAGFTVKQS